MSRVFWGRGPSPAQSARTGLLLRIRQVQCLAVLAAVDLGVLPEPLLDLVPEEIPALQVPGAEFALGVFLVAGAHARDAPLDLGPVAQRGDQLGDGSRRIRGSVGWVGHNKSSQQAAVRY